MNFLTWYRDVYLTNALIQAPKVEMAAPGSYTLVVVDMQSMFPIVALPQLCPGLLQSVAWQIRQAVQANNPVVIMQFGTTATADVLLQCLEGYERERWALCIKQGEDGAGKLLETLRENPFNSERLRFCGVYADSCVARTVLTASSLFPDALVEVVVNACDPSGDGFRTVAQPANVRLIFDPVPHEQLS